MPIEFTTNVDYKTYEEFYFYSIYKRRYKMAKFIGSFFIVIAVLLFAVSIFIPCIFRPYARLILLIITWSIFFGFIVFLLPKIQHKNMSKLLSVPRKFTFYDNHFELVLESEKVSDFAKMSYSELSKVCETRNTILLYITGNQAYLIRKSDIPTVQAQALRNLFIRVIEPKKLKIVS